MIKGIIISIFLVFILGIVYFISQITPTEIQSFVRAGYIPKIISWACLILCVYGLARRRFSPLLMFLFYFCAFFFTYLGQYIIKGIY
jgi:Ca2+/Na+ antiporter